MEKIAVVHCGKVIIIIIIIIIVIVIVIIIIIKYYRLSHDVVTLGCRL